MKRVYLIAFLAGLVAADCADAATRIKDITSVEGVRDNPLIGYGLIIGLAGTGDTMRNAPFTEQSIKAMLDHLGVNVQGASLRIRNVAGVTVTADLPAFVGPGSRIDVNISSIGDATSLRGGTLLMTPMMAADGLTYAVAQGSIVVTGFSAAGQGEAVREGTPTGGRIANGAVVEREVPAAFRAGQPLVLELRNPDFATATMIADRINQFAKQAYGRPVAVERDMRNVLLKKPERISLPRFLAEVGNLMVTPDSPARVVIDEHTGTVVIGANVQVSQVALTHGNLTVRITEAPEVSQPEGFSRGKTVVVPRTGIAASESGGHLAFVGGTNLQTLVDGLNRVGLKPNDIIAVLQAIKSAGGLQAELVVQ
jgi:flagellar P-ring protein precursor FlgI